jgi:hypothetical protein
MRDEHTRDSMGTVEWRGRKTRQIQVSLPGSAVDSLRQLAEAQGVSCEELARIYVGRGLREDLRRAFEEKVLGVTEDVLRERGASDEAASVVAEVRRRFRPDGT